MDRAQHWETVYKTKGDAELSWYQVEPGVSVELIESLRPRPRSVVDVGGGQSALAGELVARGFEGVAVLDISAAAIERGKARLGARGEGVRWMVEDVLESRGLGEFDLWHDRAVFHFLTDEGDRRRYVGVAAGAVRAGGHAIVATFGPAGPEKCSGLPVRRYDGAALASEFEGSFEPVSFAAETHVTPWGKGQEFTYVVLRRLP